MTIRWTLTSLVVFLGGALLLAVGLHVQEAWKNTEEAKRFALSDAVRAEFLSAAVDLAQERDWTYLMLHEAEPINGEAVRRLGELRGRADQRVEAALAKLTTTNFVPLLSESMLGDVASAAKALRDDRADVDGALTQPREMRPSEIVERWFSTASTLITATQNLRFDLLRALPPADKLLADHSSLKQFVWIASEQASRGRALLAGIIAERRRPTGQEFATLASADAQIGLAWRTVRSVVREGMVPKVTEAVVAAERAYFGKLMPLREEVYKAARQASAYPVSGEQWFAQASNAINILIRVEAESVRETAAHTASLAAAARRNYLVWTALGVLGLFAVGLCLVILEKRVLVPFRMLTGTMSRLAEGDLRTMVPRNPRRDELGSMVRALRRLKTSALQAQRLRAAKERAERQTLQAIREREVRLRAIFDSVGEGILTIAADGSIEAANPAAGALFGHPPEQLVGRSVMTLVPESEVARYRTSVLHYLATGQSDLLGVPQEVVGLHADGSPVQLEVTVAEAHLGNRSILTASLRDITERKRVERMKGEFVSTVSHELRTPLTSIRGALSLLLGAFGGELKGQARSMAEMAHRNTERLIALVNDILDIEKLEDGRLEFAFHPLDLVALIREAIETNQSFAAERGVALRLTSAPAELLISGDPSRLQQVMANLLSNAAKFSERGSEVVVEVEQHDRTARVTVRDRGPGVPEAFRKRIFQRFAQANSADSRQQGGTGLGLSISKAIIERHNGDIGFDSRPGDTSFYFTLPILVEEPASEIPSLKAGQEGRRILVCEDDPDTAKLLRLLIEEKGFVVDVAHTAAELKEMLARSRYAALTLDLSLPDGSGVDLIRELRVEERYRDLPLIVISARAAEGRRMVKGDAVGVIGWLTKPVEEQLLGSALRQVVCRAEDRPLRILFVENDPDLIVQVERLLEGRASVVRASSVAEAKAHIEEHRFDFVMLNLSLSDGSGLELLQSLRESTAASAVLVFATDETGDNISPRLEAALGKSLITNEQLASRVLELVGRHS